MENVSEKEDSSSYEDGTFTEEEIIAQLGFSFQRRERPVCIPMNDASCDRKGPTVLPTTDSHTVDANIEKPSGECSHQEAEENNALRKHDEGGTTENESNDFFGDPAQNRKRTLGDSQRTWKKVKNRKLRQGGKAYLGYRRTKEGHIFHDTDREERKIGPPCTSKMCLNSKVRDCDKITEDERLALFRGFWETMNWDQRRTYITSMVDFIPTKRPSREISISRRKGTLVYHLKVESKKRKVCKNMFLNTFGIKEWTVRYWMEHCTNGMAPNSDITHQNAKKAKKGNGHTFLKNFLNSLPKLPSHYCRQSSSKSYLEPMWHSLTELFDFYKEECTTKEQEPLSRHSFDSVFHTMNLSLFKPKKDECDVCCSHKVGNLSDAEWQSHIIKKNRAREEKEADKKLAQENLCILYTMDLQSVKVAPYLQASALYYKTKLSVHNFTMYDLGKHAATCYWFEESQAELVASTFATCVIDQLKEKLKEHHLPIIIFSDGCTYQNRNVIMANALLRLSMETGLTITQKFLEKGHTQMECDSVHSAIECKLKGREITLPSQYAAISKEARKRPSPYAVKYLDYDFFINYAKQDLWVYESIRPGRVAKDPTVTDLRVLHYDPTGVIYYKTDYEDSLQQIPRRPRKVDLRIPFPKLYSERLKIQRSKWEHLQQLKKVLPHDCHSFYDSIPHE